MIPLLHHDGEDELRFEHGKWCAHALMLAAPKRKMRETWAIGRRCRAKSLWVKGFWVRPERRVAMGGIGAEQRRRTSRNRKSAQGRVYQSASRERPCWWIEP